MENKKPDFDEHRMIAGMNGVLSATENMRKTMTLAEQVAVLRGAASMIENIVVAHSAAIMMLKTFSFHDGKK